MSEGKKLAYLVSSESHPTRSWYVITKRKPPRIKFMAAIIDILWGGVVAAVTASAGYVLLRLFG